MTDRTTVLAGRPTRTPSPLVIKTAADLEVGDTLHRFDGSSVLVTRLNPSTREAALAYGEREVWSGSSWFTALAMEPVEATPSERRVARHLESLAGVGVQA